MASMDTANDLMATFSTAVTEGFAALQGPVNSVFGLMITLVVALTGIQWALSPGRDLLAGAFGKILLVGSFAFIINDWQALSETIQSGFIELGLAAGGGAGQAALLNPGGVLETGWNIVKALGETPTPISDPLDVVGNLTDALILGLAMITIMIAFAVLALQIIVTVLEFKIVTLGGLVLLPFGIWSKSAFLAERPLGYVVAAGLKALALALVVSLAQTIFGELQPSENPDLYEALAILAAALLLAMLAIFIPNLAAALVTGGPALGAGAALNGAIAGAGAGALAAGALLGSGRAIASGLKAASGYAEGLAPRPPPGGGAQGGPPPPGRGLRPGGFPPARPGPGAARAPDKVRAEADEAKARFHQALKAGPSPIATKAGAGLRAFMAANAARALLPSTENTGALSPNLKSGEN
jgi:type IV secretion system protein TrbL